MWVESLTLENIKCFQHQKFVFTQDGNGGLKSKPYRWITLLGENGVGKSTLLQALALLLAGPEAAKELMPRPSGWVRNPSVAGQLQVSLHQEDGDAGIFGEEKRRASFAFSYSVTGADKVQVGKETYTVPALVDNRSRPLSWLRTNAFGSRSHGWFAVGYGPFRRLTRLSQVLVPTLDPPTRASNFVTQFDEDSALTSFERWMVYLDYRIAKEPGDIQAQKMKEVGERAIMRLLPGDVRIAGVSRDGLIEFTVNGLRVATINLSDGYRSIIALAGDLIWRLLLAYPDQDDPTQASGVVLIDELDIHLHPRWQREIAGWLQAVFPNLQFLVATHSPLIAAGGGAQALTLRLDLNDRGEVNVTRIEDLSALDADQVLRSPAFGLPSTHAPEAQEKIARYYELRGRIDDLNENERQEYVSLAHFMAHAQPIGGPPEEGSLEARMDAFLELALK